MSAKRRGPWLAAAPALLSIFLSCRTAAPPTVPVPAHAPLAFALVFVIHGDGSYLFHDPDGRPQQADRVALERARAAAAANPQAEVFVFHQHGRRGLAGRNGTLELYRRGTLVLRRGYRRRSGGLEAEAGLLRQLSLLSTGAAQRVFLFFGHQVPELPQPGYHASLPRAPFGLDLLAQGLEGFLPAGGRFDLAVLSSCNNGTPTAVAAFAPRARYLVASPADLHLSHLVTGALHHLERRPQTASLAGDLAHDLALASFQALTERVATIVTVSTYDLDVLAPRIQEAAAVLRARLASAGGLPEYGDCAEDEELSWVADLPGVSVLYRPPRFGRERTKQSHSGLGCFR